MKDNYNKMENPKHEQRILQIGSEAKPIRITIDYTTIDQVNLGITQQQKDYLISIMDLSKLFFQKLLKVYPFIGNNIFPKTQQKLCQDVEIPQQDKTVGIADSDLHLYVIYVNQKNGWHADANFCAYANKGIPRPTFGRICFNLNYIKFEDNPKTFNNNLDITIHEILHIIGFSGNAIKYWIDPKTNKPYNKRQLKKIQITKTYRNIKTTLLATRNVVKVTRKYFNCPSAEGMQIENQGASGSIGSHWERTIISNEMMTGSVITVNRVFSIFTIAALKDTGFYPEVNENMSDDIFWGKGKGCDFLEKACQSQTEYPEFAKITNNLQCSFEHEGYGYAKSDLYLDGCAIIQPSSNQLCTNPNSIIDKDLKSQESDKLSNYSTYSKCFQSSASKLSSIINNDSNLRCHQFKCSSDASQITIMFPEIQHEVLCRIEEQGQKKDIDESGIKAKGQITCPQDFKRFCNYTPICPNFCSQKGFCVKGQCFCQAGYGGTDCSIKCSGAVHNQTCIENSQCPSGLFLNPDNTCKSDCPQGFFGRAGQCQPCNSNCSRCTGPSANQCTQCQFLTLLQQNYCLYKCNEKYGFSLNQASGKCESEISRICQGNCQYCHKKNSPLCYTCKTGFFFYQGDKSCLSKCPLGFIEQQKTQECQELSVGCLQQIDFNTCILCDSAKGYILDTEKKCTLCKQNCISCNPNDATECLVCEGIKLKNYDGSCVDACFNNTFYSDNSEKCEKCTENCLYCNQRECNQCQEGYYVDFQTKACTQCSSKFTNCLACNDSQCQKCNHGYQLDSTQKNCELTTLGQCPYGCESCSQQGVCYKCKDGYYISNASQQCVSCTNIFSQCEKCTESICIQCNNEYQFDFRKKQCQYISATIENTKILCPIGCNQCNNARECQKCNYGYFLKKSNKQCLYCYTKYINCLNCTKKLCTTCFSGYYYDSQQKECVKSTRLLLQVKNEDQKQKSYQRLFDFIIGYIIFGLLLY
ncbi:leishmanolysin family protein, putative [Ichthyophthirius multifiliis]|uniref:Leishmanolysin family protein, putative n=1 Tax=Ichthyophthirius multifiliis TaxID=5932 RepID=G0QLA9_ICHMU|nr:leishmanolysin family protein, putative [Ichthyophthirius multifiliis]EGR33995.1 leishmanolysin family protein, putative [Ichthyophthirius multifiliis]|eukprot:XP_004039299.1 leishmanolysin family protein, putative [Ichthyophthirius multifiliis]